MPLNKEDLAEEASILSEIERVQKVIQQKHKMIKLGRESLEQSTNDYFKPVLTPLKKISEKVLHQPGIKREISDDDINVKKEKLEMKKHFVKNEIDKMLNHNNKDDNDTVVVPGNISVRGKEEVDEEEEEEEEGGKVREDEWEEEEEEEENEREKWDNTLMTEDDDDDFSSNLAQSYLDTIGSLRADKEFGVRKSSSEGVYKIGNSKISFNNHEIIVENLKTFPMSVGLMELLFMKNPNETHLTSADRENYIKIILTTNAHLKYYKADGTPRNLLSNKFIKYILPHTSAHSGAGLLPTSMRVREKTHLDYVYWDDPNELVERLKLLVASRSAGNPNHDNEIMSVIEELREANIIY